MLININNNINSGNEKDLFILWTNNNFHVTICKYDDIRLNNGTSNITISVDDKNSSVSLLIKAF